MNNQQSISDTLKSLRYGTLDEELGERLNELVERVNATQRMGSVTLSLKIKPGGPGRIEIIDDYKVNMPKEERGSSIMFVMPSGKLSRNDPRQAEIDGLKTVEETASELKSLPKAQATPIKRVS